MIGRGVPRGAARPDHELTSKSASPASVTVLAASCAEADAWATALMVLGPVTGGELARCLRLDVLFLVRDAEQAIRSEAIGMLFGH